MSIRESLAWLVVIGLFIGVLLFGLYNIPTPPKSEQVELEYGIFECDAPFGKYWIDESGTYLLASGHSDSQLQSPQRIVD